MLVGASALFVDHTDHIDGGSSDNCGGDINDIDAIVNVIDRIVDDRPVIDRNNGPSSRQTRGHLYVFRR